MSSYNVFADVSAVLTSISSSANASSFTSTIPPDDFPPNELLFDPAGPGNESLPKEPFAFGSAIPPADLPARLLSRSC